MMDTVHTKKEIIEDLGKHSIEIHEVVESIDHSARKGTQIPHWVWTALAACVTIGLLVFRPDLRRRLCCCKAPDNPLPQRLQTNASADLNLAVITWNVGDIPDAYFTGDEKPNELDLSTGLRTDKDADPFKALLTDLSDPDLLVVNFQEVDKMGDIAKICCQWKNIEGLDFCAKKILKVLNERQDLDEYVILKTVLPGRALTMTGTAIFVKATYQDRFPEKDITDDYVTFGYGPKKCCLKPNGEAMWGTDGCCFRSVDKCCNKLDKAAVGNKLSIIILLKYKFGGIEQTFTFVNSHFAPNKDKEGKAKWKNARRKNAAKTVDAICTMHAGEDLENIDFVFWGADFNLREKGEEHGGKSGEKDEFKNIEAFKLFNESSFFEDPHITNTYKYEPWKWTQGATRKASENGIVHFDPKQTTITLKRKPSNQDGGACDRVIYRIPDDQAEITDYRIIESTYGYSDHKAVQLSCNLRLT